MGFWSARSWTCSSAWKRPRPSHRCPGRPCWCCWSQPWRKRRWWTRAPPPALPVDSHSLWRCCEASQMLGEEKQSRLEAFYFCWLLLWQMRVRSRCQTVWAAAGSASVNISWGPEWIGQLAEFRTKQLKRCLKSTLASQSTSKVIIHSSFSSRPRLHNVFRQTAKFYLHFGCCRSRKQNKAKTGLQSVKI